MGRVVKLLDEGLWDGQPFGIWQANNLRGSPLFCGIVEEYLQVFKQNMAILRNSKTKEDYTLQYV
jgi:hypothetical protein